VVGLAADWQANRNAGDGFLPSQNGVIQENWVPIDILWILMQMGLDILPRLRHSRGDLLKDLPRF